MAGRFRASSSRWDWPKVGSPQDTPKGQSQATKKKSSISSKDHLTAKRGKYKEPETGFFFVSEDGHQVLICGKGIESDDVQAMSAVISQATVVNLSYNSIEMIPPGLPAAMTALDLSKNKLAHVYGLENVSNLRELYLGGNSIESTWGLTVATSLEILDLSANRIKLIEGLETLTSLKRLNLKFNNIKGMSAIRSLSFNKRLLVLDLSENPVAEKKDYKRNILHLIPSLEVLDDLKIGFDMFRKSNDYTTRYLNMKQFNESNDRNGFGFLWSGRPGRWDGVVFQAANSSATLSANELKALSDACAGSDMSDLYGTKHDAKKYPWRREPDIAPRPLQFNSAAQEGEYRAKTPSKPYAPASSLRKTAGAKSPTSYMEMSRDESYLNTVLSQHMERPEWNKYYKPTEIGTEARAAALEAESAKKRTRQLSRRSESGARASTAWTGDHSDGAMYMGGPASPNTEYHNYGTRPFDGGDASGYESPDQSLRSGDDEGRDRDDYGAEEGPFEDQEIDAVAETGIDAKELEATLLELVEHKKALVRRLQNARAARN